MGSKATEDFTFCHTQLFQIGSYTPETHFQPFTWDRLGLKHSTAGSSCSQSTLAGSVPKCPAQMSQGTALLLPQQHSRSPPHRLPLTPSPPHGDSLPLYHQRISHLGLWQMLSSGAGKRHNFWFLLFLILTHTACFLFWAQMELWEANVFVSD